MNDLHPPVMQTEIQPEDFERALQNSETFLDISVDDLWQLQLTAKACARRRQLESLRLGDLMSRSLITVDKDCPLTEAAEKMLKHRISSLPVVDEQGRVEGLVTEADFLNSLGIVIDQSSHIWQTLEAMFSPAVEVRPMSGKVEDIMVKQLVHIRADNNLHDALEIMKKHHIKRLLVCDSEMHLQGVITRSDLVRVFFSRFVEAS